MLDSVRLDFSGDQQLLDLLLALIAIGDTLDRWLPGPGEAVAPAADGPGDPYIDGVLGLVALRETLRRGLAAAGIDPQARPPPRDPDPAAELVPGFKTLLR